MKKCSICNKSEWFMGKLKRGYICKNCSKKLPKEKEMWSVYEVKNLLEYKGSKDFIETDYYGKLHIDEMHGLFVVGEKVKEDGTTDSPYVYDCRNILNVDISYHGKNPQEQSVRGDVVLSVALENPCITIKTIIKRNVASPIYVKEHNMIVWSDPEDLKNFKFVFNRMIKNLYYDYINEKNRINNYLTENSTNMSELEKAKVLFMLDDTYTSEDVRKQRNRLLKIYHPDSGEVNDEYSKKINDYYEILMENL